MEVIKILSTVFHKINFYTDLRKKSGLFSVYLACGLNGINVIKSSFVLHYYLDKIHHWIFHGMLYNKIRKIIVFKIFDLWVDQKDCLVSKSFTMLLKKYFKNRK